MLTAIVKYGGKVNYFFIFFIYFCTIILKH